MEPEVRYCMTTDGVRIAYTITGEGPPIVATVDPFVSHVQLEWSHPISGRWQRELSRRTTLVSFDVRGCGLSDRVLPRSMDESLLDFEAVVKRAGLTRFGLIGNQSATPTSLAYAARHPEMVDRLVVVNGFARLTDLLDTPQVRGLVAAAQADWVMATEAVGSVAFGSGREENRLHGEFIRACVGPEYFDNLQRATSFDASEVAKSITAPTLVMKHAGLQYITMEMTKDLAARLPNAQLAILEGTWADDVEAVARRIVDFLCPGLPDTTQSAPDLPSGTAVILFADIADSTALTERLGDSAFRDRARQLDAAMLKSIRDANGTAVEGKLLGDGVLAIFSAARDAISATLACRDVSRDVGLELHLGIHAGDVIREDGNVYGGAVNIASRISALSAPGEVIVSRTVADLARTSARVSFEDRGEHTLKGVAEPQRVFAVQALG